MNRLFEFVLKCFTLFRLVFMHSLYQIICQSLLAYEVYSALSWIHDKVIPEPIFYIKNIKLISDRNR